MFRTFTRFKFPQPLRRASHSLQAGAYDPQTETRLTSEGGDEIMLGDILIIQ